MIKLITGLPGAGKTATLVDLVQGYIREGRAVYAWGITDARIPAVNALDDPHRWDEVPDGSVVVIDEVQKVWPSRGASEAPASAQKLSVHRHRGIDLVIVSQSPSMVHRWVRRLVGSHVHLVRKHGTHTIREWTWDVCQDDPDSKSAQALGRWRYARIPASSFALYHSAEVHTHKPTIPRTTYTIGALIVGIPLVLLGAIWFFMSGVEDSVSSLRGETTAVEAEPETAGDAASMLFGTSPSRAEKPAKVLTPEQYARQFVERIPGAGWSAPAYQGKPQDYPVYYCIVGESACKCITQQGVRVNLGYQTCVHIATNGIHDPYRVPRRETDRGRQADRERREATAQRERQRPRDRDAPAAGQAAPDAIPRALGIESRSGTLTADL